MITAYTFSPFKFCVPYNPINSCCLLLASSSAFKDGMWLFCSDCECECVCFKLFFCACCINMPHYSGSFLYQGAFQPWHVTILHQRPDLMQHVAYTLYDHHNVIHPFPCTWEHKASTGKREVPLTMCCCFQLTSEACYKYSDPAHCAPLLGGTQTDAIMTPASTWIYFREPGSCANVSTAASLNEHRQCACLYRIITIFVTVLLGEIFQMSAIFSERGLLFGATLTDWMTDLQWDDHTNSLIRPNKISMVTAP